jgi:hypothetical protein
MDDYEPHFGGLGDIIAVIVLIMAGASLGLLFAAIAIYHMIS